MLLQPTPLGYCQCGCGQPATIAPSNNPRLRVRRGQPNRFILGHHAAQRPHCQSLRPLGETALVPVFRKGLVVAHALIDAEDWERAAAYRWRLNTYGYVKSVAVDGSDVQIHRLVMGFARGDGKQVDHIDRDKLNNRRSNLRESTPALQAQNREWTHALPRTSQYRGVCWAKDTGKWQASVGLDGRQHYLGQFDDELEAARVAAAFRAAHMPHSPDAARRVS